MGDRGNIVMQYEGGERIFFYGHWSGYRMPEVLRTALAKKWRWGDPPYLARIIFDELVGENQGEETSFGIAPYMCDNEYDVLIVDTANKKVCLHRYEWNNGPKIADEPVYSWSFEEFIALPENLEWSVLEEAIPVERRVVEDL